MLVGGTINGFINYKIQLVNFSIGVMVFLAWIAHFNITRKKIATSGIEWGIIIFIVSQTLATIFSQDVRRSLSTLAIYISYILLFYLLVYLIRQKTNQQLLEKTLLIIGAILLGFVGLWAITEFIGWRNLVDGIEYPPVFKRRVYVVLGEANMIAAFCNLLVPLIILYIEKTKKPMMRAALFLYVAGIIFTHYFCSSRGGMLALCAEVVLLLVLWAWLVPGKLQTASLRIWRWLLDHKIAILLIAVVFFGSGAFLLNGFISLEGDATHAPVASARSVFWRAAINAFTSDPITGIGPGIYPSAYMLEDSMPPGRPFLHAHSLPFTIAAESGILGVIGALGLLVSISWRAWKRFIYLRETNGDIKQAIVVFAIIVGAAVHALVDNFAVYYAYGIPMLFFITSLIGVEEESKSQFSPVWLILPALILTVFQVYSFRAVAHHEKGIEHGVDGNWQLAAKEFETAVNLDPHFGLYWLESAIAHSQIANRYSNQNLNIAIAGLNRGIEKEGNFSTNHANLAALYWEDGQQDAAVDAIKTAVELAPQADWYWLRVNEFGQVLEDSDLIEDSNIALDKLNKPSEVEESVKVVRGLLDEGDVDQALQAAVDTWEKNGQEPLVYLSFAEVFQARGKLDIAKQYLDAGLWVQIAHNRDKLELLVKRGEIAAQMGLDEEARQNYEAAWSSMTETTMYGWGSKGFTPYAWFAYHRRGLPVDIVPQFPIIANDDFCSLYDDCIWIEE